VVTLALLFGAASAALVGTGVGARFHLGQINAVDFVSTLAGSFSGPMLRIDNELPDNPRFLNSTALDLRVQPGNPPMTVNSSDKADKANNLNADRLDNRDSSRFLSVFGKAADSDRLDGKDSTGFFSGKPYVEFGDPLTFSDRQVRTVRESCGPGDVALSGGHESFTSGIPVVRGEVTSGTRWRSSPLPVPTSPRGRT
jgi:hypothetical protein